MLQILRREKPTLEDYFESHSLEIIEELFKNFWDAEKFTELFEVDVEFITDDSTIDYNTFTQALDYIRVRCALNHFEYNWICSMAVFILFLFL